MSKKKSSPNASEPNVNNTSRRDFMKTAAMGAGVAASTVAAQQASAATSDNIKAIQRPEGIFEAIDGAPLQEFAFPASGARIFAKACKDEGLKALFCCPGNYSIVTELANAGVPTYGGRLEGLRARAV